MTLAQTIFLVGIITLGGFFLTDALFYYIGGRGEMTRARLKRRLQGRPRAVNQTQETGIRQQTKPSPSSGFFLDSYLRKLLLRADSAITLAQTYALILGLAFIMGMGVYMTLPVIPLVATLFFSLFFSLVAVTLVLKKQILGRYYRFEEQFPDAIELIVRSLRVGQPFSAALAAVANEMPDPIGKEFHLVGRQLSYGRELPDALDDLLKRIPLPDLRFFVVAVQIHHESGGNLAEILSNLSTIVRGRFRLMRKVRALTVEGRFSAWFLSFFPVLMIIVMSTINPGYYEKVSDFEYFPHLVVTTAVLLIINVVAMRIMTKLEV